MENEINTIQNQENKPIDSIQPAETGELAVDVYETGEDIVIQAAIAGVKADNLDVSIEDDLVTISGSREHCLTQENKTYFHQECFWGRFSREIILPQEVDSAKAQASMKDNVFTIRLPKRNQEKLQKIEIKKEEV